MADLPAQVSPPTVTLDGRDPHLAGAEVVALPVLVEDDSLILGPGSASLADEIDLLGLLESERATGRAGEVVVLPVPGGTELNPALRRVLLVGLGSGSGDDFRRAGAALARAVRDRESVATTIPSVDPTVGLEPFIVGAVLASFSFDWRAAGPATAPVGSIVLAELGPTYADLRDRAVAIAAAGWQARFLATVPSNLKSPRWLAEQAKAVAKASGLEIKVWDEKALTREGFGGILGVGKGSANPPRFVRLDYTPAKTTRRTPQIVLVGKGITFDSGGYNLKPGEGMSTMKRDMTGAGVVLSVMGALRDLDVPVKVTGLLCLAENMVSGSAMRPGDVLRHYPGDDSALTSEINNTDAEGRLVLADGLSYAVREIKPDVLVDIATLTGAVKVALGQQVGGLYATADALAAGLREAGAATGEAWWRLPLSDLYEEKLSSKVADLDNSAGGPGSITAALFLQHFTGGLPWAHLDIASTGDAPADREEWTQGPTGFGARTLLTWLASGAPSA
ncbi:leucyl aminopeptidase family protein [Nocardioides sp. Kera G14]|uniref:leucyl aminopeptidase family protein n=1 Tax=Nocardioides sp. Kera G14 TaxID=2884264 RepID=UPI001D1008A7|nr:leucyl aminopeptidase family protein [Nocardioides sp. Kera G14]UDY22837.1 leucyl aminopeptidase family protein [Nocardioides sp. Kera G14]